MKTFIIVDLRNNRIIQCNGQNKTDSIWSDPDQSPILLGGYDSLYKAIKPVTI